MDKDLTESLFNEIVFPHIKGYCTNMDHTYDWPDEKYQFLADSEDLENIHAEFPEVETARGIDDFDKCMAIVINEFLKETGGSATENTIDSILEIVKILTETRIKEVWG